MELEKMMAMCEDNIAALMKTSGLFDDVTEAEEMKDLARNLVAGIDRLMQTHQETSELAGSFAVFSALVFAHIITTVALDNAHADSKELAKLIEETSREIIRASKAQARLHLA